LQLHYVLTALVIERTPDYLGFQPKVQTHHFGVTLEPICPEILRHVIRENLGRTDVRQVIDGADRVQRECFVTHSPAIPSSLAAVEDEVGLSHSFEARAYAHAGVTAANDQYIRIAIPVGHLLGREFRIVLALEHGFVAMNRKYRIQSLARDPIAGLFNHAV